MLTVTVADFANLSLLESPELARVLKRARVVPAEGMPAHVVTMYSHALCIDLESGERRVLRLVYPEDERASEADVSVLSPAGLALLGAAPGKEIPWQPASGPVRRLRIDAVLYQPEEDLSTHLVVRAGWRTA